MRYRAPGPHEQPPAGGWRTAAALVVHCLGLGIALGDRYLVLIHHDRHTGRRRASALRVVQNRPHAHEYPVVGRPGDEWLRNIMATPAEEMWLGGARYPVAQRVLDGTEAAALVDEQDQCSEIGAGLSERPVVVAFTPTETRRARWRSPARIGADLDGAAQTP